MKELKCNAPPNSYAVIAAVFFPSRSPLRGDLPWGNKGHRLKNQAQVTSCLALGKLELLNDILTYDS